MKIVVLNGSPRKGGNTEIMAQAFAEAARKNQNEVSILDVASMNICGCLGCKYCWAHKGECVQKDDMGKVFAALADADMVVFASPIYWFDITAQMKTVIDRLYAGADHVFDAAIAQYKAMTSYLKWEDMGIITVPNMETKGSMTTAPNLDAVVKLGESL